MSTNPTSQENAEPVVILKRQTENAFALKFHEAELLVLPAQGGDNFTPDEQHALQLIALAVNSHASDQRRIKELEDELAEALSIVRIFHEECVFPLGSVETGKVTFGRARNFMSRADSLLSQGATK